MYTLADKSHFQALAIMQGNHKLAAVHAEIMDWITKQFGVSALDFFCERREASKGLPQQLVHVILETTDDVKKMQADRANNAMITERFLKYFKSANTHNSIADPLKSNVFPVETEPFPKIVVTYRPLEGLTKTILQEMLDDEERAVLKTFESVWTMSMSVVFYYTDAQVKENLTNGTSARIIEALGQLGEKYGYDRGYSYRFDSKEIFDRDYESNWYYYWK
jgi:hypothetical protein